ncbi:MAG TPA: flagellar biosynthetic protein FliO [Stenotrophobium sp.]|jgi:flagellar protein FliO/FliZ|nr:flagellar biosynthetic protein FliO [Stenotrophobium sp.]
MAAATTAAATTVPPMSMAGSLASTAVSLVLVLLVIFALAWVLRWLQSARGGNAGALRLHGGLQVGAKERVLLVQAGDKHLLIGVAPGRVQTLHVFEQAPENIGNTPVPQLPPFAEKLQQMLARARRS